MKLFLISQYQNLDYGTYDSAVVAAPDEETARHINPRHGKQIRNWRPVSGFWCDAAQHVVVTHIGEAADGIAQGVVCASFNAG